MSLLYHGGGHRIRGVTWAETKFLGLKFAVLFFWQLKQKTSVADSYCNFFGIALEFLIVFRLTFFGHFEPKKSS